MEAARPQVTEESALNDLEGFAELQASCPPGTRLVGPTAPGGSARMVNGRVTANCVRPDGTPHGPSVTWFANGSKAMAGEYRDGVKEGEWSFWHENGQLSGRGEFSGGKPEGVWVTWHDNGLKESEGSYVGGLHHGRFTHWDRGGRIAQVLDYGHGKLIKRTPYVDGNPVE
jgi:antitoxin component YwqK of YwqJK toxin-antitoxin module